MMFLIVMVDEQSCIRSPKGYCKIKVGTEQGVEKDKATEELSWTQLGLLLRKKMNHNGISSLYA